LKESKGRGDYPIGILEGWNAGIMGLDFYFGLQIEECGIENSKSLPTGPGPDRTEGMAKGAAHAFLRDLRLVSLPGDLVVEASLSAGSAF